METRLEELRHQKDLKKEEISDLKKNKEEAESKLDNICAEIEQLKNEMLAKENIDPEDKQNLDDLTEDISNLKISIHSFEESKEPFKDMKDMLFKEKENAEYKYNKNNDKIIEYNLNIKNLNTEKIVLQKEVEDIQSKDYDSTNDVKALRNERNEKNILLEEEEKLIVENRNRIQDVKEKINEYNFNIEKIELSLSSQLLYMWEEYEITKNSNILNEYREKIKNKESKPGEEKTNSDTNVKINVKVKDIDKIKKEIRELGAVNLNSIMEFKAIKERYDNLIKEKTDIEDSIKALNKIIKEILLQMTEQFNKNFQKINENFKVIFKELFGGGKADIVLDNKDDALNSGIEIKVEPPR